METFLSNLESSFRKIYESEKQLNSCSCKYGVLCLRSPANTISISKLMITPMIPLIIGYYYGEKQLVKDTVYATKPGEFTFKGKTPSTMACTFLAQTRQYLCAVHCFRQ